MFRQNTNGLLKERQEGLNCLERKMFLTGKQMQRKRIKILIPNQMLHTKLIAFTQVKADNTFGNLLNENYRSIVSAI